MNDKPTWKPDLEDSIRKIIQTTLLASDVIKPEDLPHLVRSRLQGQVSGEVNIDQYIDETLKKMREAGEL